MKFHWPYNKEVLHSNVLEHHVIASISPDLSKYVEAISSHDPLMLTCLMDGRTSMSKGTSTKCPWPYSLPHLPKIWNSKRPILQCSHKEPKLTIQPQSYLDDSKLDGASAECPWPYSLPHLPKKWNSTRPILQCGDEETEGPYKPPS